MGETNNPSPLAKLLSFIFFSTLTIIALWWSVSSIIGTLGSLISNADTVYFNKGAMYAFGAGVVLLMLIILGIYQNTHKADLTVSQTKKFTKGLIISTAAMFTFPIFAYFYTDTIATQKGYFECKITTYEWPMYKDIIYVNNQSACEKLIEERNDYLRR